jgi:3-methylcrotonyl-CoA carboxylase alpha subunit
MEMNTRLQVEHPVTEEITGQDLVEWQLRVASGEKLPKAQDELSITGHAIEARLYAEDPAKGFLPSVGRLSVVEFPEEVARVETGVEQGDSISPYYDPMIAKLVARGADRAQATLELAATLYGLRIWPVKTNAAFLLACLQDQDFQAGQVTTGLIGQRGDALTAAPTAGDNEWMVAAMQAFAPYFERGEDNPADPWAANFGFRLNAPDRARIALQHGAERRTLDLETCTAASGFSMMLGDGVLVFKQAQPLLFTPPLFGAGTTHGVHDGEIEAPMPGKVTAVEVSKGDKVVEGQRLLTLEAMKMEHALTAPFDGTVAELHAAPGAQVTEGTLLVKVSSPAEAGAQDSA